MLQELQQLMKALEAGSYNAAPGTLTQGAALQTEDLSPVMENVTWEDKHIKLQKLISKKDSKGQLIQFNRQLDYGIFGGSAQYEGGIGEEDTSSYVRAVVPMSYYSTVRRVSVAANMISAFDGVKAEDRSADDAAKKIAGDIEFDLFQGQAHFSNAGMFDGNPLAIAAMPNMVGVDTQVRQSDMLANTQDLMFAEYGSSESVVLPVNGTLTQGIIEDAAVRNSLNHGNADKLYMDPVALSAYNKIAFSKERIHLAGSAQEATGAQLRTQWVSSGSVSLESSNFLRGKARPARARAGSPTAPATVTATAGVAAGALIPAGAYIYTVTAVNERGESVESAPVSHTVATLGDKVTLSIPAVTAAKYFNVYRTKAGQTVAQQAKFIGRVKASGVGATAFTDLGNKSPGFTTAYLIQADTLGMHQLAPFSRLKLAVSDLSLPEASFQFICLAAYQPRKNVLLDNVNGQIS